MSKVIFTGCSFTAGNGWVLFEGDQVKTKSTECKDSTNLWVNLCATQIDQLKNLEVINAGRRGASNTDIFTATAQALGEHGADTDIIFCQWTNMPRYNFSMGFELWETAAGLQQASRVAHDINLTGGTWSRKYLDDLFNRLLVLHHLHGEILRVVEYSNILKKLAQHYDVKLYFINGMCPWDRDYFIKLSGVLPEDYTQFTKKEILSIESRDDNDIFKLYDIMHNDYSQAGGIDPKDWVNLYDSMQKNILDNNYDGEHPGTKSNQLYFKQIKKFLETQ